MTNQEQILFLKKSYTDLTHIVEHIRTPDAINKWKAILLPKLEGSNKIKISRIEIFRYPQNSYNFHMELDTHELNIAKAVLRDIAFKYLDVKTKENIEALKLLKAREENIDFEMQLAEMVCGDNTKFPYRSSTYLTEFFQNLGYNYVHSGETRKYWVKNILEELNIKEIHILVSTGLFRQKYFLDFAKEKSLDSKIFFKNAANEFKEFVQNSVECNKHFDLSSVLDMNVNIELLFDHEAKTYDKELNTLIEEAKERFFNPNDKQIALEKLWDAFERIKTFYLSEGLKKSQSAEKLVETISKKFDKDFIDHEFKVLTKIGNEYRIRHHEMDKLELTIEHQNYFFFRMLTLIDLCLVFLNESEIEDTHIF
ncbi:MAG: hypothetical protein V2A75_11610 [Pseudomonadota bacterium]